MAARPAPFGAPTLDASKHAGPPPPITVANRDPDEKDGWRICEGLRGVDR